ncbi:hypothetical protein [Deinococcus arenicola]|uniref:Polysaccharide chain length determinant N-terminal domain-containing protein n=1 Tax=Deinococcus arenicola TaxID=2994950 RepID=A0ABU4DUJ5_9DEIO|nr:hypothetical protein [Deinococcus sp. ZS9-10]MDV6375364.1 hypothetical protein [Deinococcus sp. ZS9-10]
MMPSSPRSSAAPRSAASDIEFPQVLSLLRRAALPVLAVTVLAGVGGYVLSGLQPKVYEATSTVFVEPGNSGSALDNSLLKPSVLPRGGLQLALHSPAVVELVVTGLRATDTAPARVNELQRDLRAELSRGSFKTLQVEADPGSQSGTSGGGVFTLSARANTPDLARVLANISVSALQRWDVQRTQSRMEQARTALKLQLDVLDRTAQDGGLSTDPVNNQARASIVRDLAVIGSSRQSVVGTMDVIAVAVTPSRPVTPRPLRTAALAALLTLLFAGGGAVLLGSRRQVVRDWDSVPDEGSPLYRRDSRDSRNVTSTVP